MRGHTAVTIEEFKGLFDKGNHDDCPLDHFQVCQNMSFGQGRLFSRPKWSLYSNQINQQVRRTFTYNAQNNTFIIFMTYAGALYTQKIFPIPEAPILRQTFDDSADFDLAAFNNRAYIALSRYGGFHGSALYIFDGTIWKTAGLTTPAGTATVANSAAVGNVEAGTHYFGIAVETVTGFISRVGLTTPTFLTAPGGKKVTFANLPNYSADSNIKQIRLVATKVIAGNPISSSLANQPSYFIPGAVIPATPYTATFDVSFFDSELLSDASYLQDILAFPPGGSFITVYHNRLILGAAHNDVNLPSPPLPGETRHRLMVSRVNDPETFEVVDGTLLVDPSSDTTVVSELGPVNYEVILSGITDGHPYRDTLYVGKLNSMYGISDNGDIPANWPIAKVDDGNGSFLHGFVTVLDSGGVNVEYMLIANRSGVFVFNGLFNFPEMTYKISNLWSKISKNPYKLNPTGNTYPARAKNHFIIDPYNKRIGLLVCEDNANEPTTILYCDFSETNINDSEYFMNVKWSRWDMFNVNITAMCAFDAGAGTKFLGFNSVDNQLYELGGTHPTQEVLSTNFTLLRTAFVKDSSNAFIHCNGHSLTLVGDPGGIRFLNSRFIDRSGAVVVDSPRSQVIQIGAPLAEKTMLANVTRQSLCLDLNCEYMDIRRINIYVKPTFKTMPQ